MYPNVFVLPSMSISFILSAIFPHPQQIALHQYRFLSFLLLPKVAKKTKAIGWDLAPLCMKIIQQKFTEFTELQLRN